MCVCVCVCVCAPVAKTASDIESIKRVLLYLYQAILSKE